MKIKDYAPQEFFVKILAGELNAGMLSCGFNYRFGKGGEGAECIKPKYRTVASFLYELERAAMANDGGFLLVINERGSVEFLHNTSIIAPMRCRICLALDLAEHAYFLDYGFDKLSYVRAALSRLRLSKLNN